MSEHSNKKIILATDIGGSHISSALIDGNRNAVIEGTFFKARVDAKGKAEDIITAWMETMNKSLSECGGACNISGVAVAMPGPFLYDDGISVIEGTHKYEHLFGINIRKVIESGLLKDNNIPVIFRNDAACFALGENISDKAKGYRKIISITLGTGLGSAFIEDQQVLESSEQTPYAGTLYRSPFKNGIAEDYISSKWIVKEYASLSGEKIEAKEVAGRAMDGDQNAKKIYKCLGHNFAEILGPHIQSFNAECVVIGGNIALAHALFLPAFHAVLQEKNIDIPVIISAETEISAMVGAAYYLNLTRQQCKGKIMNTNDWRKSLQPLLPETYAGRGLQPEDYDLYPFIELNKGKIFEGYESLAAWISTHKKVIIDGFIGNDWTFIMERLHEIFIKQSVNVLWYEMSAFEKDEDIIEKMVQPFLGKQDSPWGSRTTLSIEDFYRLDKLQELQASNKHDVSIIMGTGAALCHWDAPVIYVDLPKNELQYRMRAGSINNLGGKVAQAPAIMYKRFYFVDWVVLNQHRQKIKDRIALVADGQWKSHISWAFTDDIQVGLSKAVKNLFRPRPWFDAGAWGGQWLKHHIKGLAQDEINYAWSFELITPENGIVLESDNKLLELSFDWIMEHDAQAVLGVDAARFGTDFPIRFDFLDTIDGSNLSIQCHPSLSYIKENFGERITQDETYYILESKEGAGVYLGFQDNIEPHQFRQTLENSVADNVPVEIENFVQKFPSHKHDLFLIPNGTIHSSGGGNLVLEISATPYIFTFKMYDWLRLGLNDQPRPINIEHAFNNLKFERKGSLVEQELISKPVLIENSKGYKIFHLPTHKEHFYDIHRLEFEDNIQIKTKGKCHVMMLVEGSSVLVKTRNGVSSSFGYAETFIIPAAAGSYEIINKGSVIAKVIKAFIK